MSIKISCDHHKRNSNYNGVSPRRDVAKKRLRLMAAMTAALVVKFKNFKFLAAAGYQFHICIIFLLILLFNTNCDALLVTNPTGVDASGGSNVDDSSSSSNSNSDSGLSNSFSVISANNNNNNGKDTLSSNGGGGGSSPIVVGGGGHYLDKLDNLERSVAAVLIKVAYGTTSTTKRSIPDNGYVPSLTTIATPPLTTLRYLEKSPHQQQINLHHRNYELDLERDHALPTSAPNADILKSNSNPTYPNPNRHHNHDRERDRHRHLMNSTPAPSIHNLLKKGQPTIPMYPGDMPSYSPPARSFFTPPLPPEYQNPFADKPTLRGTNNDGGGGGLVNTGGGGGTYVNRRPIPPPSLMPGHERIPFRPPDLNGNNGQPQGIASDPSAAQSGGGGLGVSDEASSQKKKALNTPSQKVNTNNQVATDDPPLAPASDELPAAGRVHFPSISRILSGANGKKEAIPEVLLKQATHRPALHAPVLQTALIAADAGGVDRNPNINHSKDSETRLSEKNENNSYDVFDEPAAPEPEPQPKTKMSTSSTVAVQQQHEKSLLTSPAPISSSASASAAAKEPSKSTATATATQQNGGNAAAATWSVAWNIHVYLSVILFTILAVYSIFKIIFYDKLTHLFGQSYFICIHSVLIGICVARIFYLCYDAYNIHSTFHIFASELLLNLPATCLTIAFAILILFLLIKSLNHKHNRYSALIRPLTVVVGSSVHVGLCITLHYVESYTMAQYALQLQRNQRTTAAILSPPPPPRVLSLICQIIYIFICLSLGLLYLYAYRILKRVLRSKSQNYIHGYQNLSYAIHITIATALLFVLLAALQIFGAISMATTAARSTLTVDVDWLQWGYQFSLRLIEIAIVWLMSWVAGLKMAGGGGSGGVSGGQGGALQREKATTHGAGFFLPCTSSSSQEHFETDYPAVCNANTNLHTYTLRTGKPLYDDGFALNALGGGGGGVQNGGRGNEMQLQSRGAYETGSLRHGGGHLHSHHHVAEPQTDHYENPNFELRGGGKNSGDHCYSEPLNPSIQNGGGGYDFSNFERPVFGQEQQQRPSSSGKHLKSSLDRGNYENPERRSSNSTHSCASTAAARYPSSYNSFERRSGVRKSGTLNNIGGGGGGIVHGRNGSSSSSSSSSRPSGVQTLSAARGGAASRLPPMHRGGAHRSSSSALQQQQQYMLPSDDEMIGAAAAAERANLIGAAIASSTSGGNLTDGAGVAIASSSSTTTTPGGGGHSSGDSANSGSMLVAEHGFVRFRALDDINNAQGVGIHNASLRTTGGGGGRAKEKRYTNNT